MTRYKVVARSKCAQGLGGLLAGAVWLVTACGSAGSHGGADHSGSGGEPSDAQGGAHDSSGGKPSSTAGSAQLGDAGTLSVAACADNSSIAPVWPMGAKLEAIAAPGSVSLTWPAASGADRYHVFSDDAEIATVASLSFVAAASPGESHDFHVEAAELCGKFATGPDASAGALPIPDPSKSAPALTTTASSPFPDAVRFLYTGDNPVQIGNQPGTIDERRVAVVRGKVTHCDGTPAPGVKVSVPTEPSLGWTFSRSDGAYDLAVNSGGCEVGVQFDASGSPSVQRKVNAAPLDYVRVPDVVIVPYDGKVTTVTLPSMSASSAQGSEVKDTSGARRATVVFPPGVTASMTLPNGTEEVLPTLHVRATEYTSDECGEAAMPGKLPAESAYTYAAELSVDEAVQANAKSINFSKPVALYVNNFIGFPTGSPVPTGYYDRDTQCWQPVQSGIVVKITAVAGGAASLDVNGDNVADDAATLTTLGISSEETQELAKLFNAGATLWRTPLLHFSPWDCNWPYRPEGDARYPILEPLADASANIGPEPCESGSDIGCVSGSVRETVPLPGTGNALVFSSKRGARPFELDFRITDSDVGSLVRADIEVNVAGRSFYKNFDAAPGQVYHVAWDDRDAYGRAVTGSANVSATLTYWYKSAYAPPDNRFGDAPVNGKLSERDWQYLPGRGEIGLSAKWLGTAHASSPLGLRGGWALADYLTLDPISHQTFAGDGQIRSLTGAGEIKGGYFIDTFAGKGTAGSDGDEGPALDASFRYPAGLAVARDGSVYVADLEDHRIRRITPDGIVHPVAGTGKSGRGPEEGVALLTDLNRPQGLSFDCDGSLFVSDDQGYLVRKLTPDGVFHPLPFRQTDYFEGLDGPAAAAAFAVNSSLNHGTQVSPGSDCRVYFSSGNGLVMRLDPSDEVTLVAGDPAYKSSSKIPFAENAPAKYTHYTGSTGMAYEPRTGSILFATSLTAQPGFSTSIVRVTPDGLQHLVAGDASLPRGVSGDGGPARSAALNSIGTMVPLRDGAILFIDSDPKLGEAVIRRVAPQGSIFTVAGGASVGEKIPALGAHLGFGLPRAMAAGPDGTIYLASGPEHRIRRLRPMSTFVARDPSPAPQARRSAKEVSPADALAVDETAVPDSTGSTVDVFDQASGRHLRSFDALTGILGRSYSYDDAGILTGISDVFGNTTTFAYDTANMLSTITSPFGLVTTLKYDIDGNLESVENPAGEAYHFTYHAGTQLLASFQNPAGNLSTFAYDELGRLSKDSDAGGGSKTINHAGTVSSPSSTITTALGRSNGYSADVKGDGTVTARSITKFYGASSVSSTDQEGKRTVAYEGGSTFVNSGWGSVTEHGGNERSERGMTLWG